MVGRRLRTEKTQEVILLREERIKRREKDGSLLPHRLSSLLTWKLHLPWKGSLLGNYG